jgi:hypothetical protein
VFNQIDLKPGFDVAQEPTNARLPRSAATAPDADALRTPRTAGEAPAPHAENRDALDEHHLRDEGGRNAGNLELPGLREAEPRRSESSVQSIALPLLSFPERATQSSHNRVTHC